MKKGSPQFIVQAVCYHLGMSETEVRAMPLDELARHATFIGKFINK